MSELSLDQVESHIEACERFLKEEKLFITSGSVGPSQRVNRDVFKLTFNCVINSFHFIDAWLCVCFCCVVCIVMYVSVIPSRS